MRLLSEDMEINASLGAFVRKGYVDAMRLASVSTQPLIGNISIRHAQLCPQNFGRINEDTINHLRAEFKDTTFRLHANVQVQAQRRISDLANYRTDIEYWNELARVSQLLNAPAYSAHAGLKKYATLTEVLDNVRDAETLFGCPVAIEGHYPAPGSPYLIANWKEYRQMFDSGVNYALDLSHLNIVATRYRRYERTLVREMLNSPQCIEVHISGNDGTSDAHKPLIEPPIWMDDIRYTHADAIIFSECH